MHAPELGAERQVVVCGSMDNPKWLPMCRQEYRSKRYKLVCVLCLHVVVDHVQAGTALNVILAHTVS
jgi:hypothetical protein